MFSQDVSYNFSGDFSRTIFRLWNNYLICIEKAQKKVYNTI